MRLSRSDDGVIAILVAALALVLFGLAAIVVDLGFARDVRSQAQDSADAAALAGADALFTNSTTPRFFRARRAIRNSALANFDVTSFAGCTATAPGVPGVTWDNGLRSGTTCIQFGLETGQVNATMVFVAMPPRHLDPLFGGIFGSSGVDVGGQAVAGRRTTTATTCGICVFGALQTDDGSAVRVAGGSSLSAFDGEVGNALVPPTISVTGDPNAKITFQEEPSPQTGPLVYSPDPPLWPWTLDAAAWMTRQPPSETRPRTETTCGDSGPDLRPGVYGDLAVVPGEECRLDDGTYVFTGTVTVPATSRVRARNSSLVFEAAADLDLQGRLDVDADVGNASIYWRSSQDLMLGGTRVQLTGDVLARDSGVVARAPDVTIDGRLVASSLTATGGTTLEADAPGSRVDLRSELGLVR